MKLVVAYIERETFEPIREALLELGFPSLSLQDASGSIPETTVSGTYRGTAIEQHARPKSRVECVAGDEYVSTVIDTVLKYAGERSFVFVLPVEQAYPTETVKIAEGAASV
jgi:nitrogen regulatory protein PII